MKSIKQLSLLTTAISLLLFTLYVPSGICGELRQYSLPSEKMLNKEIFRELTKTKKIPQKLSRSPEDEVGKHGRKVDNKTQKHPTIYAEFAEKIKSLENKDLEKLLDFYNDRRNIEYKKEKSDLIKINHFNKLIDIIIQGR